MASAKVATLVIRTLAKPISNQIKTQVKQHETFRNICIGLAQRMHRTEVQLRTRLLGEAPKTIRPLSDTRAIENGANALAEGFLFGVATLLIVGETWRSSRSQSKRREDVDDKLDDLRLQVESLTQRVDALGSSSDERWQGEGQRIDELTRILERVVNIGLKGGWPEFEDTPLASPKLSLSNHTTSSQLSSPPESPGSNSSSTQ